jgi:ubiquinone/menaquinone biosynthesis C-methylase UbiE
MTTLQIVGIVVLCLILFRIIKKFVHIPASAYVGYYLDSPMRKKLQPPHLLIQRSRIKDGTHVLEIGCGSGAYTLPVARAVGRTGKVFGLDIQRDMLKQLRKKLSKLANEDIDTIELLAGGAYNLPFKDNSLDLVIMITVLPEIPDRLKVLRETERVIKQGGILAVTEFLPDPDYPWRSTTIKLGKSAGFELDESSGNLLNYTVRFTKQNN